MNYIEKINLELQDVYIKHVKHCLHNADYKISKISKKEKKDSEDHVKKRGSGYKSTNMFFFLLKHHRYTNNASF